MKAMPDTEGLTSFAYLQFLVDTPSVMPLWLAKGSPKLSGGGKVASVSKRRGCSQLSFLLCPLARATAGGPAVSLMSRERDDEHNSQPGVSGSVQQ